MSKNEREECKPEECGFLVTAHQSGPPCRHFEDKQNCPYFQEEE